MTEPALFAIGKITGVHGVKGYVKAVSFAESISVFRPGLELMVRDLDGRDAWFEIEKAAPHKTGLLILFSGVDRNVAETLSGRELHVRRADLPELEEDAYYWNDLIGLKVTDASRGDLGRIESVIATGSNDVFVVTGGAREILVPALAWVVKEVDIGAGTMLVDLPEGL